MADQQEKDRWRELADLLGLPPDADAPPPASSEKSKETAPGGVSYPPPAEPQTSPYEEEAEGSYASTGYEEIEVAETHFQVSEPLEDAPAEDAGGHAPALAEADLGDAPVEPSEVEADEAPAERPRRGRRRGRRGRRDEGDREEGRARARQPPDRHVDEAADEEEELPAEEEAALAPLDAEDEPATEKPEEDDEDIDKLTDWNVPSWNELIASLYRPER